MKYGFKKGLSVLLAILTLFSMSGQSVFATSVAEQNIKGVRFIENKVTNTSANLKYYMTVDGKTALITESVEVDGDTISYTGSSVEVDKNNKPINSTLERNSVVTQKSSVPLGVTTRSGNCNWKSYSGRFSLMGAKLTVGSIAVNLVAVSGMGLSGAVTAATGILGLISDHVYSSIPSYVYFRGERCVSHSSGKIYYRYSGNLYFDSGYSHPIARNLHWSVRW